MKLTVTVQQYLADILRSRVAGPDRERARSRIWDTPGPRWFTPHDPLWRVHSDSSMFIGGLASLLLQSLHPAAMAGVAEHSGYRSDPWGRLQRTSHYIATTSFATVDQAEQMINAVRSIHRNIAGTLDGVSYAASDPRLLMWVHVAETYCFLAAHEAYGHERLSQAERDTYVAQAGHSASLLGAEDVPSTAEELNQMLRTFRSELRPTPACLDARDFLLKDPPLPRLARPGYGLLIRGAVDILPEWARQELGLSSHATDRVTGRIATTVIRWAMNAPA